MYFCVFVSFNTGPSFLVIPLVQRTEMLILLMICVIGLRTHDLFKLAQSIFLFLCING